MTSLQHEIDTALNAHFGSSSQPFRSLNYVSCIRYTSSYVLCSLLFDSTSVRTHLEKYIHSLPLYFQPPPAPICLAVVSAKGGVGKSTISANLALSLSAAGKKVGLLDADIYGPSLPCLFGISTPPVIKNNTLIPHETHGLYMASMGTLLPKKEAAIWRGPIVQKAIRQLLFDVAWPALDIFIVDMPPGTGDAHLSLIKGLPLVGYISVSTPHPLAQEDAERGEDLYKKLGVNRLMRIDNMTALPCPHCGHTFHPFGEYGDDSKKNYSLPILTEKTTITSLQPYITKVVDTLLQIKNPQLITAYTAAT